MNKASNNRNIATIAKKARVSIATVSRVINNRADVSDSLRKRVRGVLVKNEYRPRIIRNRKTNLAIVIELENPIIEAFTAGILSGIAAYAFEQGVSTSVIFMPRGRTQDQQTVEAIRERRCDAAIVLYAKGDDTASTLAGEGIPSVLVAQRTEVSSIGYIDVDPFGGAVEATNYLIGLGHQRIAYLSAATAESFDNKQRLAGYQKVMEDAGLADSRWIIPHHPTMKSQELGYEQAGQVLKIDPTITAIFAATDEIAAGAILACEETGRRVPHDISIIGFDDYPSSAFLNPPLTTIHQPMTQMGYEAAKFADTFVRDVIPELPRKVLKGKLIVRRSTGSLQGQKTE